MLQLHLFNFQLQSLINSAIMISPQETQAFPLIESQINLSNINRSNSSNSNSRQENNELSKYQNVITFLLTFILFLVFCSIAFYYIKDDFKYLSKTYRKKNGKAPNPLQLSSFDNKEFTKSEHFFISINHTNFDSNQFSFYNNKINSNQILVGSLLDFGLHEHIDYQKLQKQILKQIGYQIIQFNFDESLEKGEQKLTLNHFKDASEAKKFILFLSLQTQFNTQNHYASDLEYRLGVYLMREPQNQRGLQMEYHIADLKYGIGKKQTELPICIFTMERNIFNKNAYQEYFQSIQALNYSNFKIIYVDDFSSDNSAREIFDYLQNSSMRIKNKIKIIHNQVRIGALANLFFWTKKFCDQNDIVVNIDGDDAFIGKQVLKVISSVYENPDVWYAYSTFAILNPNSGYIEKSKISKKLSFKTSQYRRSFQWQTSHVRTYRQQLSQSVPIQSMIQYHYEVKSGNAWPVFYSSSADMIYTFALIEMAGNERIRYLNDYFYNYYGSASESNCYREHQMNDGSKSRAKTPLKKLNFLGEKAQLMENDSTSYVDWNWIEFDKNRYVACKQQLAKSSNK